MDFNIFSLVIYICGFSTGVLVIIILNLITEMKNKDPQMKKFEKIANK